MNTSMRAKPNCSAVIHEPGQIAVGSTRQWQGTVAGRPGAVDPPRREGAPMRITDVRLDVLPDPGDDVAATRSAEDTRPGAPR